MTARLCTEAEFLELANDGTPTALLPPLYEGQTVPLADGVLVFTEDE